VQLHDLREPPETLYLRGDPAILRLPMIAVVGARRASAYGERVARGLATALARAGVCVVSGLALGIDTVAHRAALDVGGATCAVLGTGLDRVHPPTHHRMQRAVAERGLLLTEYPPGTDASKWTFPHRNRLIAALARATIVVEAAVGSGALGTADFALDLQRDVAAVPGQIDTAGAVGTNRLLRDGAVVIAETADAVMLAGLSPAPARWEPTQGSDEAAVWNALEEGRADAGALATRSGLPAGRCLAALTTLELAGVVRGAFDGTYGRA
jgi:DNA processing protein